MRGRHSNEGTRRDEWVSRVVSRHVEQLGAATDAKYHSGGSFGSLSVGCSNRTNRSSEDMGTTT